MSVTSHTGVRRDRRWWRERWVADHYAKLKSPDILQGYIDHKGYSYTGLAKWVSRERFLESGKTVSRQMITYLAKGQLLSCEPDLAALIERAVDAPDHAIFDVLEKSSNGGRSDKQRRTAA